MNYNNIVSFISLDVLDINKSKSYYNKIFQWTPDHETNELVYYKFINICIALIHVDFLSNELKIPSSKTNSRLLSINTKSLEELNEIFSKIKDDPNSKILVPIEKVEWGGYRGYFSDFNNHKWELVYNPKYNHF
jgi:uncharacterized protein